LRRKAAGVHRSRNETEKNLLPNTSNQELNAEIHVGRTPVGLGLFASRSFDDGELVGSIDGKFLRDTPEYGSDYCIGLDETTTLEPVPPFSYLNHSCDPNCSVFFDCQERKDGTTTGHQVWVETLRAVEKGEELTIDYAWPADAAIPCKCGSPSCRGWVCSEDELGQLPG
jgi:uncharacterized protein